MTEALLDQFQPGKVGEVPIICSVALISFGQEHNLRVETEHGERF